MAHGDVIKWKHVTCGVGGRGEGMSWWWFERVHYSANICLRAECQSVICSSDCKAETCYVSKRSAVLTHWSRETHICVGNLTIIGSDNGLSPGRRQAIIWTNAGILLIGPLGTNLSENLIEILTFSFTKIRLNVSSAKWRPFCLGLSVLKISNLFSLIRRHDSKWPMIYRVTFSVNTVKPVCNDHLYNKSYYVWFIQ